MRDRATAIIRQAREGLFLREMGCILLAGGLAHLIAVNLLYLTKGFPVYDRVGYIYFIGVIQLVVGSLDLLAFRALRSDKKQAWYLVLLSTITISLYVLIILPTYPEFSALFKLAPAIYLVYHWWAVIRINRS